LLRERAICVTSAAELAELAGPIGEYLIDVPPMPAAAHDGLDQLDLRVFDALPVRRAAVLPSLVKVAGLEVESVRASLGRLELLGLAVAQDGGWRRARKGEV
jgi:DNA processing protein